VGWLPPGQVAACCRKDAEGEENRMGGSVLDPQVSRMRLLRGRTLEGSERSRGVLRDRTGPWGTERANTSKAASRRGSEEASKVASPSSHHR